MSSVPNHRSGPCYGSDLAIWNHTLHALLGLSSPTWACMGIEAQPVTKRWSGNSGSATLANLCVSLALESWLKFKFYMIFEGLVKSAGWFFSNNQASNYKSSPFFLFNNFSYLNWQLYNTPTGTKTEPYVCPVIVLYRLVLNCHPLGEEVALMSKCHAQAHFGVKYAIMFDQKTS